LAAPNEAANEHRDKETLSRSSRHSASAREREREKERGEQKKRVKDPTKTLPQTHTHTKKEIQEMGPLKKRKEKEDYLKLNH